MVTYNVGAYSIDYIIVDIRVNLFRMMDLIIGFFWELSSRDYSTINNRYVQIIHI